MADGRSKVQHHVYSSFGELREVKDNLGNNITNNPELSVFFSFTGREFDSESGLYYYRARTYDASIGRFLEVDPDEGREGVPITTINKYIYSINNPENFVDPSGMSIFNDISSFVKGIGSDLGKVGSIVVSSLIFGPLAGPALAVNFSGQFSEKDKRLFNFGLSIALAVAFPTTGLVNAGLALTDEGNFIDNFNKRSLLSFGSKGAGAKSSLFNDFANSWPVRIFFFANTLDENDDTINRRTDRACRVFFNNKCPL